ASAALGVPHRIRTDNGPAYSSNATASFFSRWGIIHDTGIPHSPTGQAIMERMHQS
ncbi:POK18 protein, partial [Baryphthengus martii]|nr:POK18 protein [Baryphthengus martii]